jgi:Secretion system C-terminal sorting domain/Peptidase family M28
LLDSAVGFNRRYKIGLRIRDTTDDSGACDHIPFAYAGYPALNVSEGTAWEIWGGADPYYHRPTDTHDKLHPGLIRRGAQFMLATIAELAQPLGRITSVTAAAQVPSGVSLDQNYPNPFNPSTTIRYGLSSRSHITLTVYNTLGQIVRELVNGDVDAGYHEVTFEASGLTSGVYFYRMRAGDFLETKRLLLLR